MKGATASLWVRNLAFCLVGLIASLAVLPLAAALPVADGNADVQRLIGTIIQGETGPVEVISVKRIDPLELLAKRELSKRELDDVTARPQLGPKYANATYVWNPIGIQITTAPVLSEAGNVTVDKRQVNCNTYTYTTQSFLSFWSGEWAQQWVGHCDVFTWSSASACTYNSISESTTFNMNLEVGWRQIITASIGVQYQTTSTNGRAICVQSSNGCGCKRLWTQDIMTWHQGTHYTDYWMTTRCGTVEMPGKIKTRTDRVDNIHIDAGKKDENGLLVVVPGGSPCSDGPSWCGVKDWGCK